MRVLDVLGRRWALRALWELRHGALTFRALRAACDDISPSSLNQRLAELRAFGVVMLGDDGYRLTPAGIRLGRIMLDLYHWAEDQTGKTGKTAKTSKTGKTAKTSKTGKTGKTSKTGKTARTARTARTAKT
jgi:DNA-binding HxlR family transcriptional regulator